MEWSLPPGNFSGFIFDCDGTLADSMPLHFRAWRHALAQAQAPFEFTWELFVSRAGMTQERTVEELNRQFDCALDPVAVAEAQHRRFERDMERIEPIHSVVTFAREVSERHPVAVASGGERQAVLHTLELIGVRALFDTVVVAADVERGKPAPDLFLLAAERIGVPPSRCLVFEDSLLGLQAAHAAGMQCVLLQPRRPTALELSADE
ncbi:MAG TPA: HAD family phosphatase [Polyangiaceae bacterium]|nr:HAD family phosphatase [Polyangiaceae bacterium]